MLSPRVTIWAGLNGTFPDTWSRRLRFKSFWRTQGSTAVKQHKENVVQLHKSSWGIAHIEHGKIQLCPGINKCVNRDMGWRENKPRKKRAICQHLVFCVSHCSKKPGSWTWLDELKLGWSSSTLLFLGGHESLILWLMLGSYDEMQCWNRGQNRDIQTGVHWLDYSTQVELTVVGW